jgi:glycine cleavage system H protein
MNDCASPFLYKRSRFTARLPHDRIYVPSHFWLQETEKGVWRVGLTQFAVRMLGDLVEHEFTLKIGEAAKLGQAIGWFEGFKAVSDLYCAGTGEFLGGNPALNDDSTLVDTEPYGRGWLYSFRGQPDPNALDVQGYVQLLDLTIDKMQRQTGEHGENDE